MKALDYFHDELINPPTNYFIFDTKGGGNYGDVDFTKYEWDRDTRPRSSSSKRALPNA
jgi:hypothetical protein